jgi:AcrR family transcriptional regulator
MARPSHKADEQLIEAALALMPRQGLASLRIRQVARRAGVNLGMFHYHFKSKSAFIRRVLQTFYARFFDRLTQAIGAAEGAPPRDRLRAGMLAIIRFGREHRGHMLSILRDALDGNAEAIAFIRENFPRHIAILYRLLRDAQRAGVIRRLPLPVLLPVLAAPQLVPVMGVAAVERVVAGKLLGFPAAGLAPLLLSDRAITARLDLSLAAVSTGGGRA